MKRRPLVAVFLSFSIGILAGKELNLALHTYLLLILALLIAMTYNPFKEKRESIYTAIAVILSFLCLGAGRAAWKKETLGSAPPPLEGSKTVKGTIRSYPRPAKDGMYFELKPNNTSWKIKVNLSSQALSSVSERLGYGDKIILSGSFTSPPSYQEFNYKRYLLRKGIYCIADGEQIDLLQKRGGNFLFRLGWKLRKTLSSRLNIALKEESQLLKAILLGEDQLVKPSLRKSFRETGLTHLLAASGLHLGIVIGAFWFLFSLFPLRPRTIYLLTLPPCLLYLLIVGFKTPILRATIIFVLAGFALVLKDKGIILSGWQDNFQTLSGAALLLLLIDPYSIFRIGFQLSFSATFSIAFLAKGIEENLSALNPRYLRGLFAVSLAAFCGIVPAIALHFHLFHPWTPLLSPLAILATTAVLYGGLLVIFTINVPLVGDIFASLESWVLELLKKALDGIPTLFKTQFALPRFNLLWIFAYVAVLIWFKYRLERNKGGFYL